MKITLISPYSNISAIGLRGISSYLKSNGFDTRLILLPIHKVFLNKNEQRYQSKILKEVVELCRGSEVVGISLMTDFLSHASEITRKIKQNLDSFVVWGGVHPTIAPQECLDHVDAVCVGEGEEAMLDLAMKMKNGEDYYDIPNWWFKQGTRIVKNEARPLMQNLDSLPFADYDLEDEFVLDEGTIRKMDDTLFEKYITRIRIPSQKNAVPAIQLMGSRGCPHSCSYCANNMYRKLYYKQRWLRKQSPARMITELKAIKSRFPFFSSVIISDDSFLTRTEKDIDLFSKLYRQQINLPFRCLGSPLNITQKKLKTLTEAGLFGLQIGIQSGSPRTLKLYQRKIPAEKVLEVAKLIDHTKGLKPIYDIITDNPYESFDDQIQTFQLLLKLKRPYQLNIFSLTFYPGTELYDKAHGDGTIDQDYYNVYSKLKGSYMNIVLRLFEKMAPKPILVIMANPIVASVFNTQPFSVLWRSMQYLRFILNRITNYFARNSRTVKNEI